MAKYRAIQTKFWNDPWILELTPEQKYFYIYLLTNPNVTQCGIYEISVRQVEYETGYNKDTVNKLLELLEKCKKIKYSYKTSEICIINFSKYNFTLSPQVKICIIREFADVKDKDLIPYVYGIDTKYRDYVESIDRLSIDSGEKEKEKTEEKEMQNKIDVDYDLMNDILSFFGFSIEKDDEKKNQVFEFLKTITKSNQINHFKKQFVAYKNYKSETGEKIHGFSKFFGEKNEKYQDGGWNSENWEFKLNNIPIKTIKTDNQDSRYNVGETDHGKTIYDR